MFSGFIVLFDSNVFYPAPVCDLFVELATTGIFRAKWTERIHEEWVYNLLKKRSDIQPEKLEKRKQNVNASIADCLVENYENLIGNLNLPDPDDRHVLAAAIKGEAQIIVTYNLKDFPNEYLNKFGIESQHPDDFFLNQVDLNLPVFLTSVKNIRSRLKRPIISPQKYIDTLRKHSLLKTAEALESFIFVI